MDEPFGALDAQTRLEMQELLLQVWDKMKRTVLFITHDIDEAILLADVVYVMTARPGTIRSRIAIELERPDRARHLHHVRRANDARPADQKETLTVPHQIWLNHAVSGRREGADGRDDRALSGGIGLMKPFPVA